MDFDPDKYLASKEPTATGFDPDKYLHGKEPMGWGEYLSRGATGALPIAGLAGVAALGAGAAGPVGAVAGGAAGYSGGKELEGILNHYLFNDEIPDTNPLKQAARVSGNALKGATYEMGGAAGGKVLEAASDALPAATDAAIQYVPKAVGKVISPGTIHELRSKAGAAAESGTRSLMERMLGRSAPEAESALPEAVAPQSMPKTDPFSKRPMNEPSPKAPSGGIDPFTKKPRSNNPEAVIPKVRGTKFEKPLADAAARGDDAYRSMAFLMGQQYPEFRELTSQDA